MMEKLVKQLIIFLCIIYGGSIAAMEEAIYEKYVDEIVNSFARDMKREHGLICIGSGGRMPQNVETIKIRFDLYQRITLEEARELVVKLKENLVQRVNVHEKIRPFLKEYPFTWRGADISIAFYKPRSGSHYLDGSVAFLCSANWGKEISYERAELQKQELSAVFDEKGNIFMPSKIIEEEVLITILQETNEEALRIVKAKG